MRHRMLDYIAHTHKENHMAERKMRKHTNPVTKQSETCYEGDRFWQVAKKQGGKNE